VLNSSLSSDVVKSVKNEVNLNISDAVNDEEKENDEDEDNHPWVQCSSCNKWRYYNYYNIII
jgi:hypothetical protein